MNKIDSDSERSVTMAKKAITYVSSIVVILAIAGVLALMQASAVSSAAEPVIFPQVPQLFVEEVPIDVVLPAPITAGSFTTTVKIYIPEHQSSPGALVPGIYVEPTDPTPGFCSLMDAQALLLTVECWIIPQDTVLTLTVDEPNIMYFYVEVQGNLYRVTKAQRVFVPILMK